MQVRVRRWTTRVRVPPRLADRPWRAWCERLVRGAVGRRLLEQLALQAPGTAAAVDLEGAVVVVRQLSLRVRLRGRAGDHATAEAWARGLVQELERGLAETTPIDGARGGRASERVALFPSGIAAEVAALRARDRPPAPWWVERVLQGRGTAEIVASWIAAAPAEAPRALLDITGGRPGVLARQIDPVSARALTEALAAAWQGRPAWVAPRPDPSAPSVDPAHLALLLACEARLPGTPQRVLPPPTRDPSPAIDEPAEEAAEPEAESGGTAESSEGVDGVVEPIAPVDLGGLLFLLQPLRRHPVLAEVPWEAWPGQLSGLCRAALDLLLEGVEPVLAERIVEANAPALDAFVTRWPPPEPTLSPDDARRVLREVLKELSDPVRPIPVAGDRLARALVPPAPPWGSLYQVVVRPARLRLTDTHADLFLPPDAVDVALRRVGWDLDPGFVPGLRRVVRFHYGGAQ